MSFRIAVSNWGLFVDFQRPLNQYDRTSFIDALRKANERLAKQRRRGVLLDLRRINFTEMPDERVRSYVGIARAVSAQRVGMVVSSWPAAARLSEALGAADLLKNSRIAVVEPGTPRALVPALRWVSEGVDIVTMPRLGALGTTL